MIKLKKPKIQNATYNNVYGIFFILIHAVSIATIYTVMASLTKEISSSLAVFLYKFTILVCILPWCFYKGINGVKTSKFKLHLLRGFLSVSGALSFFYAIKYVGSVADATAIGYLEQVLLVIIGILYFKEAATFSKIATILISFLGALIVMQPQLMEFNNGSFIPDFFFKKNIKEINPYYGFVFLSIMFWACNAVTVKLLGKTEKTKVQLFYVHIFACIFAFPLAFMKWELFTKVGAIEIFMPSGMLDFADLGLSLNHIKYIIILAVCYFAHSIVFFLALKYAELSTVIPFDYSRLIFTAVLGYIFLEQEVVKGAYVGYIMIAGAGIYLARNEAKRRKKISNQKIMELEEEYERT